MKNELQDDEEKAALVFPPTTTAITPKTTTLALLVHSEFQSLLRCKVLFLAFVFCAGQLLQELIAESIFTKTQFSRPAFEVAMVYALFQQMGTVVVAAVLLLVAARRRQHRALSLDETTTTTTPPTSPFSWLIMIALSMLIFASTVLPNVALRYVQFPAKVIAKSSKLVPTMCVSVLLGNAKGFSWVDYCSAVLIVTGAVVFALYGNREADDPLVEEEYVSSAAYIGLLLLSVASLADALVPNIQQFLMKTGLESAERIAFRVNVIGSCGIFAFLVLSPQEAVVKWVELFWAGPTRFIFWMMWVSGMCSGVAILAFTMLIREAGSVVAVAVGTGRKVLTLTLSYVVFPGKEFGSVHLMGASMVALGMMLGPLAEKYYRYRANGE